MNYLSMAYMDDLMKRLAEEVGPDGAELIRELVQALIDRHEQDYRHENEYRE